MHPTLIEGAKNWALANKSDPFAYDVAMSAVRNGTSTLTTDEGKPGYYSAEPAAEERKLPDGRSYTVTTYRNLARP